MTIYYKTNVTVNQLPEKPKEDKHVISPEIQKKMDNVVLFAIVSVCILGYLFSIMVKHY